jgi:hypothetical protein
MRTRALADLADGDALRELAADVLGPDGACVRAGVAAVCALACACVSPAAEALFARLHLLPLQAPRCLVLRTR